MVEDQMPEAAPSSQIGRSHKHEPEYADLIINHKRPHYEAAWRSERGLRRSLILVVSLDAPASPACQMASVNIGHKANA